MLARQEHRSEAPDGERVDLHSLQNSDTRSIGIAQAAIKLLDFPHTLRALAHITGRIARSERATNAWFRTGSATGERLGIDFGALSDRVLYRASDHLFTHKTAREDPMFGARETLFNLPPVVTLYDLTNTSFEGEASGRPEERRLAPFSTTAASCAARRSSQAMGSRRAH